MIKKEEIRQMPLDEIKIRLQDLEDEMGNLKFQLALHQLDNPVKVRHLRKDVAFLKTVIREYELGIRKENKSQS